VAGLWLGVGRRAGAAWVECVNRRGRWAQWAHWRGDATDWAYVDSNMHAKGPYREVLDWLADQVDRLDEHARELTEQAEQNRLSPEEIEARNRGIVEARAWLAEQLAHALTARGMALAA
jgi:hypothetical protein